MSVLPNWTCSGWFILVWNAVAKCSIPLSATEMVLLKYCSSTFHDVSFTLLVTPQKPQQLILIAANNKKKKKAFLLLYWKQWNSVFFKISIRVPARENTGKYLLNVTPFSTRGRLYSSTHAKQLAESPKVQLG